MNVNRNLQCVYSAPRPLGISPLEPPVPPICVGHETRIASFNLRVVRCTCGAAMEFFIIYRSLFPIQWVVVPWMLDERYTFPPEFESLQHQIVKKNDQCFRGQMLEHHCKIYIWTKSVVLTLGLTILRAWHLETTPFLRCYATEIFSYLCIFVKHDWYLRSSSS